MAEASISDYFMELMWSNLFISDTRDISCAASKGDLCKGERLAPVGKPEPKGLCPSGHLMFSLPVYYISLPRFVYFTIYENTKRPQALTSTRRTTVGFL